MSFVEPSFEDAQRQLADWSTKLAVITRNANELSEAEATKRIRNRLRDGTYTGLTRDKAGAAVQSLRDLMDDYLVLAHIVELANQQIKGGLFDLQSVRAAKVMALLNGPSVALPAVHVPLAQRGLLTQADSGAKTTPAAVLAAMETAFTLANDIFAAIDSAETALGQKEQAMRAQAAGLAQRLVKLNLDPAQIPPLTGNVDLTNPLERLDGLGAYQRSLDALAAQLDTLEKQRAQVGQALAAARARITELATMRTAFESAQTEAQDKFGSPPLSGLPAITQAALDDKAVWLDGLENNLALGRFAAVLAGVRNVDAALDDLAARATAQLAQARKDLDVLDDVRGRFKALRAKAAAVASGTLNPDLATLEQVIAAAFKARPIPLAQLQTNVSKYEVALRVPAVQPATVKTPA